MTTREKVAESRRLQILGILHEAGKVVNSTLDVEKILQNIVRIVVKELKYDQFSILIVQNEGLVLAASHRHPMSGSKKYFIPLGKGVTGTVAKSGKMMLVSDTSKSKDYLRVRKGMRSELAIPIKFGKRTLGVFNVESQKLGAFDEEDVFLFTALSEQAAIALKNAETAAALERSNTRLVTLNEIARIINSSLDLDTIFKELLHYASRNLHYHFCAVLLIENGRLYSRAGFGFTKKEIATYNADIGEGICGMVAKSAKPILENNVTKSRHYKNQAPKTRAEMAVPLKVEGKVIGVLNIESRTVNAFTENDVVYLSALADQVAVAIRNAQLYGQIKQFNAELSRRVEEATGELQAANLELKRLSQMKSEFVSTVSHELRTPLTSIHGYSSLLAEEYAGSMSAEQKEFLRIIKSETQRLTRLINDLLDISKIESGRMRLVFEDFKMDEFMSDYVREIQSLASEKSIVIEVKVPSGIPTIRADADKVKQIFHNLLSNAIKFSYPGKKVVVKVSDHRGELQVDIADEGVGIGREDGKRLFQKFYRVDNSMTRTTGGTGLGLAITKHLVEQHSGKIWFSSKEGKGTTFSFTLAKKPI